ncbi:hypothetical protein LCGC14_0506300 [marine sediment metagenome]|uniref:Methyltransferase type 11 domain-containing protein n=1 Tax=marine sediment metagenome TaxID=412755 RepID=A0A0F9S2F8_9ZZZZ
MCFESVKMKKIDGIEYHDINEIAEIFHDGMSIDEIRRYFEFNIIKGKKIDNEWYSDEKGIKNFIDYLREERAFTIGPLDIEISKVTMEGRILDIGGGGEGVIGQLKGKQVVSIDYSKDELEEAPESGGLKIVMDANDLKFLDDTFDTVTAFYSIMYIPLKNHKKVLQEIYRVLKPRGEFLLWDLTIPEKTIKEKNIILVILKVKLKDKVVETGYGVKWDKMQDANYFINLGKVVGFEVLEQQVERNIFYLRFTKK